jgi:hypothetical protein
VELAIHRWDAQHAAGLGGAAPARPLDAAVVAADIEKCLTEFLPGLLAQPEVGGLTGTLHLLATDDRASGGLTSTRAPRPPQSRGTPGRTPLSGAPNPTRA